jgi:hypothetical protein
LFPPPLTTTVPLSPTPAPLSPTSHPLDFDMKEVPEGGGFDHQKVRKLYRAIPFDLKMRDFNTGFDPDILPYPGDFDQTFMPQGGDFEFLQELNFQPQLGIKILQSYASNV